MSERRGIALHCDTNGVILRVVSDDLGLGEHARPGMPFARLAARGNLDKALSFMVEVNQAGAAYDWEINIAFSGGTKTLHFTGGKVGDDLLIVAAENGQFAVALFEEMMRISNEQTNALRAALKGNARDQDLFDEISRLNNELVSMQRELAKKNAELEQLNREKNRFLGMAAHDLRNPLNAILAYSEILKEEDPASLGGEYQESVELIYHSSEFMLNLVEDLLDVSRIESGTLTLDYAPVDLVQFAERNLAVNRLLASRKEISLRLEAAALPPVWMDASKMQQVLNNLVSNALKFSPRGAEVLVGLAQQGDSALIRVQDHGMGIAPEEQANLFKPFQRGKKGSEGEKSTGLGLVIAKRVVEGHGGKLWLESEAGSGTTFFVGLPFAPLNERSAAV